MVMTLRLNHPLALLPLLLSSPLLDPLSLLTMMTLISAHCSHTLMQTMVLTLHQTWSCKLPVFGEVDFEHEVLPRIDWVLLPGHL